MAKQTYSIRTSIDRSWLDTEIRLHQNMPPLSLKTIGAWVGSILALFWLLSSTPAQSAGFGLKFFIVIWWLALTFFLAKYTKTKELNATRLPAAIQYATPGQRKVLTRSMSNPSGFYSVSQIDEVSDQGFIRWHDGTVGQAYLVVGSASLMLFDEDKRRMIDRVESFWRKIDTNVEFITVTTKEPQRVYRQLAHLAQRNANLEHRDPDLFALMAEQQSILADGVGGRYNSIHQYLILKADNIDALRQAHTLLSNEAQESSLMFKEVMTMDRPELLSVLRTMYQVSK